VGCKRGDANHGPYAWFNHTGSVYQQGFYVDGNQEGEWISYHDTGTISARSNYSAGQPDGEEVAYHASGKLQYRTVWKAGQPTGKSVGWYENGNKSSEMQYAEGQVHGVISDWYENGTLRSRSEYDKGQPHGLHIYFHDNGNKRTERVYSRGQLDGTCRQWTASGKLLGTFDMKAGTGTMIEWWDNGAKMMEMEQTGGSPTGRYTMWHENGRKQSEGRYSEYSPTGEWTYWNMDGSIARTDTYKPDGQESITYEAGQMKRFEGWNTTTGLRLEGGFENGKRHGEWKHIDNWGDVRRIDKYKRGKLLSSKQQPRQVLPKPAELAIGIDVCDNLVKRYLSCDALPYETRRMISDAAKMWKQSLADSASSRGFIVDNCRAYTDYSPPELARCP
jgi:antitoxin component YwqK of YwqJK toxin-antitoxin module